MLICLVGNEGSFLYVTSVDRSVAAEENTKNFLEKYTVEVIVILKTPEYVRERIRSCRYGRAQR